MKPPCDYCGNEVKHNPWHIRRSIQHFCSKKCMGKWNSKNRLGNKSPRWIRGYTTDGRYKYLSIKGRFIAEHRYVMEQNLGRKLKTTEHVHHINHDRFDNRISNLEIFNWLSHIHHHAELQATPSKTPWKMRNKIIMKLYKKNFSIRGIARKSGIPRTTVKRRLIKILQRQK